MLHRAWGGIDLLGARPHQNSASVTSSKFCGLQVPYTHVPWYYMQCERAVPDYTVKELPNRFTWNLYCWKCLALIYILMMFSTIFVQYLVKYSPLYTTFLKRSITPHMKNATMTTFCIKDTPHIVIYSIALSKILPLEVTQVELSIMFRNWPTFQRSDCPAYHFWREKLKWSTNQNSPSTGRGVA